MRGSTLNANLTLFFGAHKAWWYPLYIGEKWIHEVILSNVGLIFHDQVTYLEPIFPKIEAYFGLQGVRVVVF